LLLDNPNLDDLTAHCLIHEASSLDLMVHEINKLFAQPQQTWQKLTQIAHPHAHIG
jgi:hypothetical protein